ncbi:hypothetical protein ElyMa_006494600 [Elysia marginata]|uniref:Uncharacterized protein n=1 Tax=Elysia marginata TaxID=1093978 RepID=A0AAV4I384_9GAST|nr:hypothetical protein ElyMa_006494600 [Elysia marginata]
MRLQAALWVGALSVSLASISGTHHQVLVRSDQCGIGDHTSYIYTRSDISGVRLYCSVLVKVGFMPDPCIRGQFRVSYLHFFCRCTLYNRSPLHYSFYFTQVLCCRACATSRFSCFGSLLVFSIMGVADDLIIITFAVVCQLQAMVTNITVQNNDTIRTRSGRSILNLRLGAWAEMCAAQRGRVSGDCFLLLTVYMALLTFEMNQNFSIRTQVPCLRENRFTPMCSY